MTMLFLIFNRLFFSIGTVTITISYGHQEIIIFRNIKMNDKPLSCTIKPVVSLAADFGKLSQSGCKIVDISFPSIVNPEVC